MAVFSIISVSLILSSRLIAASAPPLRPLTPQPPQLPTQVTQPQAPQSQNLREITSAFITQICDHNKLNGNRGSEHKWDTKIPNITINAFLFRYVSTKIYHLACQFNYVYFHNYRAKKYIQCHENTFVMALILIARYEEKNPGLSLNYCNVYRLLATAMMVAHKVSDDTYWSSSYYAKVFGLSSKGMIQNLFYFADIFIILLMVLT